MSHPFSQFKTILFICLAICFCAGNISAVHPSYSEIGIIDTVPFYDGGTYDEAIPKPNDNLAHPIGQWPLRYYELEPYLHKIAAASDRIMIEQHGQSHEGRALYNIFISTPENLAKLDEYTEQMNKVAEPRVFYTSAELDNLISGLPAFVWLGYSIHGDEISGVDAAAQLIYQLAAGTDQQTQTLLENLIIIIDPIENPDGRERYLSMLQSNKSFVDNYDARSMQHSGVWPWGRGNHYGFDLNRDYILQNQPETKGRMATMVKYKPVMSVDAHEMGSNATYLFSPPRQPINPNTAGNMQKWWDIFASDQATAFDQRGWSYYTGEWNDQWYPGYGSAWPAYTGSIGILYEQAGVDGNAVKQRDDYILSYHEAVNHQFTSSIANLTTAADNREQLLRDYRKARAQIVKVGQKSQLSFFFVPDSDELKVNRFISSLIVQGIEVSKATADFTVTKTTDVYHNTQQSKKFPTGTYIVKTDQPSGSLAKAVLEFDPRLPLDFLKSERKELEKYGETRMYETSAWSTPLAYDIESYYTTSKFTVASEPVNELTARTGKLINADAIFGYLINMQGEKTYRALNRIFGQEFIVFASRKDFTNEGHDFKAGTLLLKKRGNRTDMPAVLTSLAEEIGIDIIGTDRGLSTKGSHLGAPTFRLLTQPKVAILSGDGVSITDYATLWHAIDRELEIPHSVISVGTIQGGRLTPYNVLVIPSSWGGSLGRRIGSSGSKQINKWVKDGGTLIVSGRSSFWAADSATGLTQAKQRRQTLDKLDIFELTVERQQRAEAPVVDTMALWHPEKVKTAKAKSKDDEKKEGKLSGKKLEELDKWERRFMPNGTILSAVIDTTDWMAFGMKSRVPAFYASSFVLMTDGAVHTPARLAGVNDVRLSGLLWPEARNKLANAAFATHERRGKGQVILFASTPNSRAYFYGTRKMFVNAVLYGPGMGTYSSPYGTE